MLLRLPTSLYYPITVTELLKHPGDPVRRDEALFAYVYRTKVTEGDGLGNKREVWKTFPTRFESSVDGELVRWRIGKGDEIGGSIDVVEIDEPCAHEVQFGGMCANCGKDMTVANYNTEFLDSMRAPIRMVHDNSTLTVSQSEAKRVEEDAKRRLLASNRLSLVVDLDQTIIHATVDPTVGEWQQDKGNPNHEAVKDVRAFQLIDDGPGMRGCWYYIKLRPGLEEFLQSISKLYELHIYTMGTRAYAQSIANIVDPDRKIFGDRILSRDESGSLTAKNLQRLFPVDTKMVVIIDDRGDVWKWTDNLIKVSPYDFFVGIGDINSSFLPKKPQVNAAKGLVKSKKEQADSKKNQTSPQANGSDPAKKDKAEVSALEQLVTMGGGDNPVLLQEQTNEQEETIAHQVEDRPLLQKQKELDAEDEAAETKSQKENGESSSGEESPDSSKHRHHLLDDHDTELYQLQERLERVHRTFFEEYDLKRTQSLGGRVSALRGERAPTKDKDVDLMMVPDIKIIMPRIKREVLEGVVLVFSGVLPLGTDMQNADISLWAKSFGAILTSKINSRTTHLVAGRNRTAKVREAARYPNIKIVTTQWLLDSVVNWKRQDEEPYLVPVHPEDKGHPRDSKDDEDNLFVPSSDEDTGMSTDDNDARLGLQIDTADEEILKSSGLTEHSPIGYDAEQQAAIHDELKAFLGSDDEESESDSEASSIGSEPSTPTKKRKREDAGDTGDDDVEGEDAEEDTHGSRLSQKIKRSHERSTGLKTVANVDSRGSSSLPGSEVRPMDDERMDVDGGGTGAVATLTDDLREDDADDHDDDSLEREMMAAFEDDDWEENEGFEGDGPPAADE
ncbi:Carboxy-terminal domain (CTD) phosphatase [Arachnomyces sp. PD_36]|nr:Carboxy-terminal domain (CTD) phosphatase [Arachnomyces sp. PD_36]